MSVPPIKVLADDLTGAAEIAGIANRFGLKSAVVLDPSRAVEADVTVWDLDTRLQDGASAARIAEDCASKVGLDSLANLFVKVDSVLRGPVCAQLEVLAKRLGARRVLLAPANPSRGRVISQGNYFINGDPLHETVFAQDPHHPARSSNPSELLGPEGDLAVAVLNARQEWAEDGIIIAEASTPEHLAAWATRLDSQTLAAGAADFFTAILEAREVSVSPHREVPRLPARALWICGSTASPSRDLFGGELRDRVHYVPDERNAESIEKCAEQVSRSLQKQNAAILTTRIDPAHPLDPAWVRDALAGVAENLVQSGKARHLLIEGGATSAGIMRALGYGVLITLHEWAPGIVSFRPDGHSELVITTKPGSYMWPRVLFQHTKFSDKDLF